MHKLLLLGLSFLCTIPLQAQIIYEYVFHERHGHMQAIDINENNYLVAAGSTMSCPEGFIAYFNPGGRLFWKKPLREYLSPATDVFFDRQGGIVVVGTKSTADDVGSPVDGIYMLKLDSYGSILFYKRFRQGYYLSEKVHAVQLPDSNYLAGVRNRLFWARTNGDSLQTRELPVDRIIDLTVSSDSTFLVLGKNRVLSLNLKGNILADFDAEEDFVAACSKRDTTWLLGNQNIWVISEYFSSPRLFPLQDITDPAGITPKQNGEGVLIWSNNGPGHTFLNFSEGFWSVPEIDPIEIINGGEFNVKEFVLSSSQQGSFNCSEGRAFYGIIDSVDMELFESKKINIRFWDYTYLYASNGGSLERCFFVAAPNHSFDQYFFNNTVCSTLLTSTRNLQLPEAAVSVFPNPSADRIQIRTEGDLPIESIELFNLAGQLKHILNEIHFDQGVLHRGSLPAGLYWLRVRTKEGIAVKKVVFQ